jgi:L-rhamnose mutarotase
MKRVGQVIRLRPEKEAYYRELHANAWPDILDMIKACNIENYTIFLRDGCLFSYFEYTGDDYEADMAKMAADPRTQDWWAECKPCQQPLDTAEHGEWWADTEEVFHLD